MFTKKVIYVRECFSTLFFLLKAIFSVSKGLAAALIHSIVQQGFNTPHSRGQRM